MQSDNNNNNSDKNNKKLFEKSRGRKKIKQRDCAAEVCETTNKQIDK